MRINRESLAGAAFFMAATVNAQASTMNYIGAWTKTANYTAGAVVTFGNQTYYATGPNLNSAPSPANPAWKLIGTNGMDYKGAWSNATTYNVGAVVTLGSQLFYSLQAANLNKNPVSQTSYWAPIGTNGNTLRSGSGAPPASVGVVGDFWINTTASTLQGPKTSSGWPTTMTSLVGPQGPKGETGVKGPKGDTGSAGSAGATGATGDKGDVGATGATGTPGINGNTILSGAGAPPANAGAVGDFWINTATNTIQGPKIQSGWPIATTSLIGPQGATGETGAKGDKGDTGLTGATGLPGPKGDTGSAGATGDKGDKGDTGATGATGTPGVNGNTVLSGVGAPPANAGAEGDFWINTATNTIQGPKTQSGWPIATTSLIGPQGATGETGAKGETGAAGATGPTGAKGDTGLQGIPGTPGIPGAKGDKGDQGATGPTGPAGPTYFQRTFFGGIISGGGATQLSVFTFTPQVTGKAVLTARGQCVFSAPSGHPQVTIYITNEANIPEFDFYNGAFIAPPSSDYYISQGWSATMLFDVTQDNRVTYKLVGNGTGAPNCIGTFTAEVFTDTLPP